MEKDYNFECLYNEIVAQSLDELEVLRENAAKENKNGVKLGLWITLLVTLIFAIIFLAMLASSVIPLPISLIIALVLIIFLINIMDKNIKKWSARTERDKFDKVYFDKVFLKIAENLNINNEYEDFEMIDEEELNVETENSEDMEEYLPEELHEYEEDDDDIKYYSDFFERADKFKDNYLIEGNTKNFNGLVIKSLVVEKSEKTKDGNLNYVAIFDGTFARVKMKKSVKSDIIIKKCASKAANKEQNQSDSKEFERLFNVYSDDVEYIKQIIKPEVQEVLLEYCDEKIYEISICGEYIYILIDGNIINPVKGYKVALDKEKIYSCYRTLKCIIDISEKLV